MSMSPKNAPITIFSFTISKSGGNLTASRVGEGVLGELTRSSSPSTMSSSLSPLKKNASLYEHRVYLHLLGITRVFLWADSPIFVFFWSWCVNRLFGILNEDNGEKDVGLIHCLGGGVLGKNGADEVLVPRVKLSRRVSSRFHDRRWD